MFTPDTPNFQSLMLMLDAAHMGWWKADFQAGELHVSEYIAKLLGLDGDKVRIGQLTHLVREDYRMPIHNEFMALKVDSKFDRTFPIELPEGEVWLHAQLVGRQTDPATGTHLFGYMQRVPVHDRREAEILTLENNYHTVVKENKHMDVLLDHLPIGYFRIRLLYDSDGRAIDYLFLSVNRAAQQIVGIEPDAYIGKTARETGHPVDAHIDKLAHIRLGNYKTDEWFAKKTRRHCRSFLYNTPNDGSEIVILILDITDAITAHKALDEQEKLLRNIIQNAPVGIEIYNDRGRLIDINTCDLEMFGVKDPKYAGSTCSTTLISRRRRKSASSTAKVRISPPVTNSENSAATTKARARGISTGRGAYAACTTTGANSPTTCSSISTTPSCGRSRTGFRSSKPCSASSPNMPR